MLVPTPPALGARLRVFIDWNERHAAVSDYTLDILFKSIAQSRMITRSHFSTT